MMIFTFSTANSLPSSDALAQSVRQKHPDSRFVLCLLEEKIPSGFEPHPHFYDVILPIHLPLKNREGLFFRSSLSEVAAACEPHVFQFLFDKYPEENPVFFLQADSQKCVSMRRGESAQKSVDGWGPLLQPPPNQQIKKTGPWSYDFYDNGTEILADHRAVYAARPDLWARYPNPFKTSREDNYLHWYKTSRRLEKLPAPVSGLIVFSTEAFKLGVKAGRLSLRPVKKAVLGVRDFLSMLAQSRGS